MVCNEDQPDAALDTFMKLRLPLTNKHAPINKMTVKSVESLWIDEELKNGMVGRDEAKGMANKSGCTADWQTYCKLRNHMTKLNKKKKKLYYETKINDIKKDSEKLWSTLNDIFGKMANSDPSFIESDGSFITKHTDIANYFNHIFIGKISKHRQDIATKNSEPIHPCITDQIMKDKHCNFEFRSECGRGEKSIVVYQQ